MIVSLFDTALQIPNTQCPRFLHVPDRPAVHILLRKQRHNLGTDWSAPAYLKKCWRQPAAEPSAMLVARAEVV